VPEPWGHWLAEITSDFHSDGGVRFASLIKLEACS